LASRRSSVNDRLHETCPRKRTISSCSWEVQRPNPEGENPRPAPQNCHGSFRTRRPRSAVGSPESTNERTVRRGSGFGFSGSRQGFGEVYLPCRTRAASGTATARVSEVSRKLRRSTTRLLGLRAAAARGGIVRIYSSHRGSCGLASSPLKGRVEMPTGSSTWRIRCYASRF
jgi:hypothetical protein